MGKLLRVLMFAAGVSGPIPAIDGQEPTSPSTIAIAGVDVIHVRSGAVLRDQTVKLKDLGYKLLKARKIDEAVEIFKLNVDAYPTSANAYDSLGEGYMVRGDRDLAIHNYRRSLELNPRNDNAVEMLRKLGAARQ